jgi:hypothetical protein
MLRKDSRGDIGRSGIQEDNGDTQKEQEVKIYEDLGWGYRWVQI